MKTANEKFFIETKPSECRDCYKCVRECPVKAISIKDGLARVVDEKCILCGHCISVCPAKAKVVRNDIEEIEKLVSQNRVILSLAPSYISEFKDVNESAFVTAVNMLGFEGVSETAIGAEIVSKTLTEKLEHDKVYFSTACPAAVNYIATYKKDALGCVTNYMSPVLAHAKFLKNRYGNEIKVVFAGPCVAKKSEVDFQLIDGVLTFTELREWFDKKGIAPYKTYPKFDFIPFKAGMGKYYPYEGGMIKTLGEDYKALRVSYSGVNTIKDALEGFEPQNVKRGMFVELLACDGGCVNGPCMSDKSSLIEKTASLVNTINESSEIIDFIEIEKKYEEDKKLSVSVVQPEESTKALREIGKYSREDELNCSGCGYDSCRDLATAIAGGMAEKEMCVSYMRKLAQNKANAIVKALPAGIVIVDGAFEIIECNKKFADIAGEEIALLYNEMPGLAGASLKKIFPYENFFMVVMDKDNEVLSRDIKHGKKLLKATFFSVEKNSTAGAIVQDMTDPSIKRDEVIDRARTIIRKNLATVQNIAYLLGENAAESETLLESIIDVYKYDSENKKE